MSSLGARPLLLLGLALAASACSDADPAAPEEPTIATLTVDAAQDWALVTFDGDEARTVTVAEPATSQSWDLGFFATSVMLNGGAAGPVGVVGHCLCQNAAATDEEVTGLTADGELAAFEAVTATDIPADGDAWTSDALAPAIDGWYSYNPTTHVVSAAPENVWRVRTASGEAFAKLHVTDIADPTQAHAGRVTLEFAVQSSAGEAFRATETATVDLSSGPVYFDLETAAVTDASAAWDLLLNGYTIQVNGGVSGSGSAGALLSGETFDSVTDASDLSASLYHGDAFGGVFDEHPWYRYNIQGNHQI